MDAEVRSGEGMALAAMGGTRVSGWRSLAAEDVHSMCDGLQVCWVDTVSVPAEMIELEADRDFADEEEVGEPMS